MIGKKSIYGNYAVKNVATGKETVVRVQADKLYRICDVIYPVSAAEPQKPQDPSNKGAVKAYNEAKLNYDCVMQAIKNKRQIVMNSYKGRQLNSEDVQDSLGRLLFNLENA